MTSVVIALLATAVSLPIGVGGLVWAVAKIIRMAETVEAALRETSAQRDATREAEKQRDDAVREAAIAKAAADTSDRLMRAAQDSAAKAREELTKHVEKDLVGASPADLVAAVDRLLATALPGSPGAGADGHSTAPAGAAVQVVDAASADRGGR